MYGLLIVAASMAVLAVRARKQPLGLARTTREYRTVADLADGSDNCCVSK
jgi:hypothetical protein